MTRAKGDDVALPLITDRPTMKGALGFAVDKASIRKVN
jgi:hypothetical protein